MTTGTWQQVEPGASWTHGLTRRGKPPKDLSKRVQLRSVALLLAGYALIAWGIMRLWPTS